MWKRWAPSALALLAALAPALAAREEKKPDPSPPQAEDLYGDPLPAGAAARLGTLRLRSAGSVLVLGTDGKTLFTAGGNRIQRWNAADGALQKQVQLPEADANVLALSPDGKIAAVREGQGLAMRDADSGKSLHFVEGFFIGAAFSPDGGTLAACDGVQGRIRLVDVVDGKERLLNDRYLQGMRLVFSPDGRRLVVGDSRVHCLDVKTGKVVWTKPDQAIGFAFSPDGRIVAACLLTRPGGPNPVFLDAETGKPAEGVKPPSLDGASGARFGPDGDILAVEAKEGVVIWDLKTGKERRTIPKGGYSGVFAPDGKTLTGFGGGVLQRWDLATGKTLYNDTEPLGHLTPIEAVAYSPDGKRLASMSRDGSLRIWDVGSRKMVRSLSGHESGGFWEWAAFTPDGRRLLSGAGDATIRVWDPGEGKEIRRWTLHDPERKEQPQSLMNFHLAADGKRLLTLSPVMDGNEAFGPSAAGTLTIWDAASGERLERRPISAPRHSDVFSPDGRRRAAEGGKVYDDAGRVRLTLKSEQGIGTPFGDGFAFSPDGALLASVLWETVADGLRFSTKMKGIQVWELATGAPVLRLPAKEFGRFAFSPDGRRLAIVDKESIHLWDIADGREVSRQTAPPQLFGPYGSPFAFAPDGRSLATGLEDTSILIWDLAPAEVPAAPRAVPLTAEDRDALWTDLAGADAVKAHQAVHRLIARPGEAVPLLRDRMRPAAAVPAEKLQRLVADLDADDLNVREAASRQLTDLRRQIESGLSEALKHKPTAEQRRRIEAVLDEPDVLPPGDALRGVRAALALERIGSPEARKVLEKLADGAADAPPTQEARDALKRLDARK